jgi:Na+/proline symporter
MHAIFSFGIIDFVIILGFLAATLFVGIKHGLEITDLRGYAVGNNNFKTFALVATITATYMSGSGFFYDIKRTYQDSTLYLFSACLMGVKPWIMAMFIIPKMKIFIGRLTIAEKMGEIYNDNIRLIIALTGIFASIGNIAVQFKVFGTIIAYCTNVDPNLAIIVAGITVTLYSALGGIKSVTTTDKLQLATFLIAIPYILLIVIDETFYKGFSSTGAPPLFDIKPGTFSAANPKFWDLIILGLWFMFPNMHPVFCQRIMMAKNVAQAKVAFKYSAYLVIFITILLGLISLMVYNYDPNIADNQVISYIIDNFTGISF